jgi:hypothetical protein
MKFRKYLNIEDCELSGSHGDEYEDDCLMGRCAVKSGRNSPLFRRRSLHHRDESP